MSNPKLLDMPLAQNADKNDIPVTDSGSTGLFSQQYGWQLINAIPPQNGGKAVKREDFNGVFNLIGDLLYHIQKGYTFEYDSRQSYWKGCKVRDPATGLTYQALNDIPANSTNSPHKDTSNWVICPAEQGYIIPSTAYAVGATANHYALPPSYYLECTTGGTTGATAPVITSVTAGQTITDGTVVWTIRKSASTKDLTAYLPLSGGGFSGINHNGIYRGKNLGTFTSVAQIEAFLSTHKVSTGEFEDLYLGDYFTIQDGTYNKEWEIASFDHYLHKGDTDFTTHHIVLIPKTNLTTSYMNSSNTTAGGYAGSYMHTTVIPAVNTNLAKVLGNHLLTRRELLTTSMSTSLASMAGAGQTGASNNWEWSDVKSVLPNEVEIYGCTALSSSFYDVGNGCEKLSIFNFKGHSHERESFWLRAVFTDTDFCHASAHGCAHFLSASRAIGVRPLICVG